MDILKKHWISFVVICSPFLITLFIFEKLPEEIPMQWGLDGVPTWYADKFPGAWFLPIIGLVVWVLMVILPIIDPKGRIKGDEYGYSMFIIIISVFLVLIHSVSSLISLNIIEEPMKALLTLFPVFFLFMGNFLPKLPANYLIGIRTPWTLESEDNWKKTHRFSSWIWVGASVIVLMANFLAPESFLKPLFISYLILIMGAPLIYSLIFFLRKPNM